MNCRIQTGRTRDCRDSAHSPASGGPHHQAAASRLCRRLPGQGNRAAALRHDHRGLLDVVGDPVLRGVGGGGLPARASWRVERADHAGREHLRAGEELPRRARLGDRGRPVRRLHDHAAGRSIRMD